MKRKFVILNNGLRDHRGHYFETSISIAEAARRAGLHPVLATHVDCRTDLLPAWLETYPIFCTDHWMSEPPAAPPDLNGVALDPYACPAEAAPSLASRLLRRSWWACRKAAWLAERSVYYLLPPLVYDGLELAARLGIPRILRPEPRARVTGRARQIMHRLKHGAAAPPLHFGSCLPETARSLGHPFERPFTSRALQALQPLNLAGELEHALIFKRDLERLLAIAGVGPEDHVLLGTAHARELSAVQHVARRLAERCPTFHLEFRHPLFQTEAVQEELEHSPNVRMQRAFFSLYQANGPTERIKFYTDTEELARDYGRLAKAPFGVLPIPFRSELIATPRMPAQALRLAYIGEARDEKGFPWLPELIDRLMEDYVRPGRVRFLLQANVSAPQYNPLSAETLDKFRRYPREQVELFGADAPLSPDEYYALVSRADVVLLPYDRNRYRACSSGTLAEAIAGGRPVVVPASSWMSSQIPLGAGETFHDFESFVEAVKRLVNDYDAYRAKAQTCRAEWVARHAPDRLVAALTGEEPQGAVAEIRIAA
ncbi:MAG TPA: glycosyltransferase [Pirellulales bacterium]|nr:glycosyltransferase [Pirellulales bacterium]